MLRYKFDPNILRIAESENENDTEFRIHILQEEPYLKEMKAIRQKFEEDRVYTDVLFYLYPQHEYRVIVRKDHYGDFVLELMKHRLLKSVEWSS